MPGCGESQRLKDDSDSDDSRLVRRLSAPTLRSESPEMQRDEDEHDDDPGRTSNLQDS